MGPPGNHQPPSATAVCSEATCSAPLLVRGGQGSSDAPGDPSRDSGQSGLFTVAAPRALPGSWTPQLLHPSANRPWPWPGHTRPGKSTQLCSLYSLEPLPFQGPRGDGETQASLHFQVAAFTYFSWLSRGLSPLPRLPVLLGGGPEMGRSWQQGWGEAFQQSLRLTLCTQLSPNASGQGGFKLAPHRWPSDNPPLHHPPPLLGRSGKDDRRPTWPVWAWGRV